MIKKGLDVFHQTIPFFDPVPSKREQQNNFQSKFSFYFTYGTVNENKILRMSNIYFCNICQEKSWSFLCFVISPSNFGTWQFWWKKKFNTNQKKKEIENIKNLFSKKKKLCNCLQASTNIFIFQTTTTRIFFFVLFPNLYIHLS